MILRRSYLYIYDYFGGDYDEYFGVMKPYVRNWLGTGCRFRPITSGRLQL